MARSAHARHRRAQEKCCLNKTAYSSFDMAQQTARSYRQSVYHCRFCGRYHLTRKIQEDTPCH